MNAQFVILTHFSQRYPGLPALPDHAWQSRCCVAFDGMVLGIPDLARTPALQAALASAFPDRDATSEDAPGSDIRGTDATGPTEAPLTSRQKRASEAPVDSNPAAIPDTGSDSISGTSVPSAASAPAALLVPKSKRQHIFFED